MIVARITLITPDGDIPILESRDGKTIKAMAVHIVGEYIDGMDLTTDPILPIFLLETIKRAEKVLMAAGIDINKLDKLKNKV